MGNIDPDRTTIDRTLARQRELAAAAPGGADDEPLRDLSGERIGGFTIKDLIATGGMGSVYEAIQEHPRRIVALKLMREGLSTRSAKRRFEYESQILARLRHPAIAQVYEAGTHHTPHGEAPYFAMEYVPGARTITQYAEARHLSTAERLELFAVVCDAVHHGHQKGVIHRDLKPGNILVDTGGRPKVIDFGVARATDSDMAVTTLQTNVGQLVGTLQYMSPEQIEANPHDLDTRSDVYSLGVVLYELLCGALPYDVSQYQVFDAARAVREQHPKRLSTIDSRLRGDIETIALKALEKDRDRRYQSAAELAQDIHRYLCREPILARPASIMYQLRMFARRNRFMVASAATILLLLVAGLGGTMWGWMQALESRDAAEQEERRATRANEFLHDMISIANPYVFDAGPNVTVVDMMGAASQRLPEVFADDPEIEARLRETIGTTYRNVARFSEAEREIERAWRLRRDLHGADHPLTLRARSFLGGLYSDQHRLEESERVLREVLERQLEVLGDQHEDAVDTMNGLGWTLYLQGRPAEAEPLFARALATRLLTLGEDDARTCKSMTNLALTQIEQGKLAEAERNAREGAAGALRTLGERHPHSIYATHIYAWWHWTNDHYQEALDIYEPLVATAASVLGETHPNTLFWKSNVALLLTDMEQYERAEPIARTVYAGFESQFGAADARTREAAEVLVKLYTAWGRDDDAARYQALASE